MRLTGEGLKEFRKKCLQEFIFRYASLAGDVGGMVGMMLGASVLSLYDDLIDAVGWAVRRVGSVAN